MPMSPHVGKIVYFFPHEEDTIATSENEDDPLPAIVTAQLDKDTVNVAVFDAIGRITPRGDVPLFATMPKDDDIPDGESFVVVARPGEAAAKK